LLVNVDKRKDKKNILRDSTLNRKRFSINLLSENPVISKKNAEKSEQLM